MESSSGEGGGQWIDTQQSNTAATGNRGFRGAVRRISILGSNARRMSVHRRSSINRNKLKEEQDRRDAEVAAAKERVRKKVKGPSRAGLAGLFLQAHQKGFKVSDADGNKNVTADEYLALKAKDQETQNKILKDETLQWAHEKVGKFENLVNAEYDGLGIAPPPPVKKDGEEEEEESSSSSSSSESEVEDTDEPNQEEGWKCSQIVSQKEWLQQHQDEKKRIEDQIAEDKRVERMKRMSFFLDQQEVPDLPPDVEYDDEGNEVLKLPEGVDEATFQKEKEEKLLQRYLTGKVGMLEDKESDSDSDDNNSFHSSEHSETRSEYERQMEEKKRLKEKRKSERPKYSVPKPPTPPPSKPPTPPPPPSPPPPPRTPTPNQVSPEDLSQELSRYLGDDDATRDLEAYMASRENGKEFGLSDTTPLSGKAPSSPPRRRNLAGGSPGKGATRKAQLRRLSTSDSQSSSQSSLISKSQQIGTSALSATNNKSPTSLPPVSMSPSRVQRPENSSPSTLPSTLPSRLPGLRGCPPVTKPKTPVEREPYNSGGDSKYYQYTGNSPFTAAAGDEYDLRPTYGFTPLTHPSPWYSGGTVKSKFAGGLDPNGPKDGSKEAPPWYPNGPVQYFDGFGNAGNGTNGLLPGDLRVPWKHPGVPPPPLAIPALSPEERERLEREGIEFGRWAAGTSNIQTKADESCAEIVYPKGYYPYERVGRRITTLSDPTPMTKRNSNHRKAPSIVPIEKLKPPTNVDLSQLYFDFDGLYRTAPKKLPVKKLYRTNRREL